MPLPLILALALHASPDPQTEAMQAAIHALAKPSPEEASRMVASMLPSTTEIIDLYRTICFAHPGDPVAQRAAILAAGLKPDGSEAGWEYFTPAKGRPLVNFSQKVTDKRVECKTFGRSNGDVTAVGAAADLEEALGVDDDLYLATITHDWLMSGRTVSRDGHKFEYGLEIEKRKSLPMISLRTEWHR